MNGILVWVDFVFCFYLRGFYASSIVRVDYVLFRCEGVSRMVCLDGFLDLY